MTHNVETINHALRGAAEAEMVHTQSLVTEHYLPMWEVLNEETEGAWPEKSLTKKMISNSERLTDLFVFLTPEQRSEFARDSKFVQANFDAVIEEAHTNGWRKLSAIRKAIQKAQKAEEPTEEVAEEATEEATEKELEKADYVYAVAAWLAKAQNVGFDSQEIVRLALKEVADPDPLEIPEKFRR